MAYSAISALLPLAIAAVAIIWPVAALLLVTKGKADFQRSFVVMCITTILALLLSAWSLTLGACFALLSLMLIALTVMRWIDERRFASISISHS